MKRVRIPLLILTILSFLATCALYPSLPDQIPINFNEHWIPDTYGPKYSSLLLALLGIVIYLVFEFVPKIDPKRRESGKSRSYAIIATIAVSLMVAVHWFTIAVAMEVPLNVQMVLPAIMGIAFLILGNYMPKMKANYFIGVRTPWTLADETVWKKTNRQGGYLFVALGILFLFDAVIPVQWFTNVVIGVLIAGVVWVVLYSYLVFRKLNKE